VQAENVETVKAGGKKPERSTSRNSNNKGKRRNAQGKIARPASARNASKGKGEAKASTEVAKKNHSPHVPAEGCASNPNIGTGRKALGLRGMPKICNYNVQSHRSILDQYGNKDGGSSKRMVQTLKPG